MRNKNNGQMIILMGIVLALSVFTISLLSADIINLESEIINERSSSIITEFSYIKETFGKSMNYNLANNVSKIENLEGEHLLIFKGEPSGIAENFTKTRDQFYTLELTYHNIFDAKLNKYWYSHITNENRIYYLSVTLSLDDGKTYLSEDITFSVIC